MVTSSKMAEQPVRTTGDRPGEAAMESTTASSDPEVHSADSQSDQPELSSSNADGMTDTVAEDGSGVDGTTANVADVALEDDKPKKKKRNKKTGKKRRHITGFEGKSGLLSHTCTHNLSFSCHPEC